jgi:mRNA interferase YafQ
MLEAKYEPGFSRDVKTQQKKHRDMDKLKYVLSLIMEDTDEARAILETKFKDHQLTGDKKGRRECHIDERVDWLLGYVVDREIGQVSFVITGSHDYLFGKKSRL